MLRSPRTQSEEVAGWSLQTLSASVSVWYLGTWTRDNGPGPILILFLHCGCSDIPPPVHQATDRSTEASSPAGTKRWRNAFNVGQFSYRAWFSTKYSRTEVGWADIMAVEMSHNVAPCVQWEKSVSAVFLLMASQDSGLTPYTFNSRLTFYWKPIFFITFATNRSFQAVSRWKSQKLWHNILLKQIIWRTMHKCMLLTLIE